MSLTFFQTIQSFGQFINNWIAQGKPLVSQEIANARAAICASCHNNVATHEIKGGCSACQKGSMILRKLKSTFIGSRTTPSDAKLKACALCGCPLQMKVWMPLAAMDSKVEEANAFPTFCWRKAIVEGKEIL